MTANKQPKSSVWSRLQRLFDSFAYPLRTSHYVELLNPLWASHALQAKVVEVWDETKDTRTLTLKPSVNWRSFRAGQHVRVGIALDGENHTRTYTISSPPERKDGRFTITVKAIEDGRISHHIVRHIKVGMYLPISMPMGDFYLPDAQPVKPLFITAGSGITPAISMLRSLIAQNRFLDCVHIHYSPHEFDMSFHKELIQMDQAYDHYKLHCVFTHEYGELKQSKGYFNEEQLSRLCPDWRDREAYACGPQPLLTALESHYEKVDMSRHLNIERFRAELIEIPKEAVGGQVHFIQSGLQVKADANSNLLRVAEDAGINPIHGCRMGICHTCNSKLVSGCVRDLRNGNLISEPGSIVQVCVCAAASDCEIDL